MVIMGANGFGACSERQIHVTANVPDAATRGRQAGTQREIIEARGFGWRNGRVANLLSVGRLALDDGGRGKAELDCAAARKILRRNAN
eukprot:1800570-Rhodomonas_salina.1